jgi:hypothetical protein
VHGVPFPTPIHPFFGPLALTVGAFLEEDSNVPVYFVLFAVTTTGRRLIDV